MQILLKASRIPRFGMLKYLSCKLTWCSFFRYTSKQDKVAKKPYNPIIGEIFQCSWRLPPNSSSSSASTDPPVPQNVTTNEEEGEEGKEKEDGAATESSEPTLVTFCGEQVSHHPPISAFQISCPSRRLKLVGAVHTASHFRGLSIYVNFVGKGNLFYFTHKLCFIKC